jgi:hypothetical protein
MSSSHVAEKENGQRLVRDDVFRVDDFFAAARPPRAPAARTDIVPLLLFVRDEDELRADDFFAVARPPFAPAFFFCAVVPARPPFAPAAFTDSVPRPLVLRAAVDVFFRVEPDDFAFVFGVAFDFAFGAVREAVLVFFRDGDDDEDDEDDEDEPPDFVSPDCARCLLTVRAAISFARFVEAPLFFSASLMCSYCRSRFALHAFCGIPSSSVG